MTPILSVRALTKTFRMHARSLTVPSCADVDFDLHTGQLTALVGPTGAGKSSVLRCIWRSYRPTAGRIIYQRASGETIDLAAASDHTMLALRNHEIAFVTQFLRCLPRRGALDVVAEPLRIRGTSRAAARFAASELLNRLDVPEHLWELPPATFSGGEQQRVNLARGLIGRPRVLLLDEPTASLDPKTTDRVVQQLIAAKRGGITILAVFHHPQLVERLADQVITLRAPAASTTSHPSPVPAEPVDPEYIS